MENKTLTIRNPLRGETAINIVELLTWYPLAFGVLIFAGSYFECAPFIYFMMMTWVLAFYVGSLLWLILSIWLLVEKIITKKKALTYFLIAVAGIILSCCVWIYDIFDFGFKYID